MCCSTLACLKAHQRNQAATDALPGSPLKKLVFLSFQLSVAASPSVTFSFHTTSLTEFKEKILATFASRSKFI
jgi:tRNA U34 5-methylaminomethyl-2-thiouridine-forming methyltransferase MnmC